jgi:subtilase family serine protease
MSMSFTSGFRMARTVLAAAAALGLLASSAAAAMAGPTRPHPKSPGVRRVCAVTTRPGIMSCMALLRTDIRSRRQAVYGRRAPSGFGYGPSALRAAYKLPSATNGVGQTVAVVDAFNNPKAVANLATYRKAWGEPACDAATGAGCLTVVNQSGQASPLPRNAGTTGWATEESLDLDMVSAICPNCHIILVEADTPSQVNLGTGVNSAIALGADYVSNSYGGKQSTSDPGNDAMYYQHPGIAITASAGDNGYGVIYPAASQYVTSVGGTSLYHLKTGSRAWTEYAWDGTGSGCAKYEAKPSWQTDKGCTRRTDNDVAAVADPFTGVAVYDTYDEFGWTEVGGTSASSPIIASVYALAGPPAAGTYPASYPYAHTGDLYDVTTGVNGFCKRVYLCEAEKGYDGPTGWGTPHGTGAFTP